MSRVLIIEDEVAITAMYEFRLKQSGYEVGIAYNGLDGLMSIRDFKPDLILLDLRMPIMNGDEMLEKLRATDWGANIRVVILTNISKSEAPMSLRLLGVDRYIVKAHHTPRQVVDIVNELLGKK